MISLETYFGQALIHKDTWRSTVVESVSLAEKIKRFFQLQPALVRGAIVAASGLIALVLGHTVIDTGGVDVILNAYTAISALVGALWIRPAVTPHVKVVAYKPDPFQSTEVATGPADDLVQALGNLDSDDVDVDAPPVDDPSLVQQDSEEPVQTDNSAREEDGDQSDVSQEPVLDEGDEQ
jgi:hypothetical protein